MAKPTKLSRRTFLQSSVAAGVTLSLPWLPGCGDGSDDSNPPPTAPEGRRHANLHFDLSHVDHPGPYVLHAIGSRANKTRLKRHTSSSRARYKRGSRRLQGVANARLTHFIDTVDLPARAVQHIWVSTTDGRPLLSKIVCGDVDPSDPDTWLSSRDMAVAMVFHHNEIMRLDPDQAAIVCAHIEGAALDNLAKALESETALDKVPVTDFDGNPVLDDDGTQFVQYDPSEAVLTEVEFVVRDVLHRVFDDPALENANWHSATGQTFSNLPLDQGLTAQAGPSFGADFPFSRDHRSSAHGVYFYDLTLVDAASRTIELEVKNFWLRWVAAYVDFFPPAEAGSSTAPEIAVPSTQPPLFGGDLDFNVFNYRDASGRLVRSRFIGIIGSNSDVLGIPILPEHQLPTALQFEMPAGAATARVSFFTLGLRGHFPSPNPQPGTEDEPLLAFTVPCALTVLFNIGIPAFLLASAVGTDPTAVASFTSVARDKKLWLDLLRIIPLSILRSVERDSSKPFLISVGSKTVSMALKLLPTVTEALALYYGRASIAQAVPLVGWCVKIAAITAATAKLAQTVGEVLSSPPIFENAISLNLTTRLRILHDPENPAGFPATATRWVVHATYDGKNGLKNPEGGALPSSLTDPIDLEFTVTSGGTGRIDVWFLTDNNWIAGHGTTGEFTNVADRSGVLEQTITITENLVPLTAMTRYHHRQKLAIDGGRHVWTSQSAPPIETAASLVCDDGLCDLHGITLNETSAILGYSWQARSATVPVCGAEPISTPIHRLQNVSFTQRPDDGLKRALCGYDAKPLVAYQLRTRPGQTRPLNFYLDPTGAAGGYHLRSVELDTAPFDQTTRLSWGQFSAQQNAMAIHPSGYVVGIDTQRHKLEILRLPKRPAADEVVAAAIVKAGRGTRLGLLDTPFAVGVDPSSGAIYVLEGGNARIQAFDVFGNPTARFGGGTSEALFLTPEPDAIYLDMAVESTGWIYVLSFAGSGANPADYRLDIYDPDGPGNRHLSRTTGVAAGKLAVDLWRNVFTLNYEPIIGPNGVEPSISEWIPSTPDGCDQTNNPFCGRF